LFFLGSCTKEKTDFVYDNRSKEYELSSVRIVNLGGYTQVVANGDTLTNTASGIPTEYFTSNGRLPETWMMPKALFEANGKVDMHVLDAAGKTIRFSVDDQGEKPVDLYTIRPEGSGQPYAVPIARDTGAPSKPDHFKIRIVNLCKTIGPLSAPLYTGPVEDLTGDISLVYADGSPVSAQTSDVSISQRVSDYVELPYGTYQFKVLSEDGRQVSSTAYGTNVEFFPKRTMDPLTSRVISTGITYAPIKTYQPGGVYTIVVAPFAFAPILGNNAVEGYQNQFKIVEDVPEKPNTGFGKVQLVNASPDGVVNLRLNGQNKGALSFTEATDYYILSPGEYTVEAVDRTGTVLAVLRYPLGPSQNHTVWAYRDVDGELQLIPVVNDLSTTFYRARNEDDGSNNRFEHTMSMSTRFLNFCPDEPYVSITVRNGQDMRQFDELIADKRPVLHDDEAMYNLRPGQPHTFFPYVRWGVEHNTLVELLVFRSRPGITPGTWADDIPELSTAAMIANPGLYTQVGRELPATEPGIFSIALVGRTGDDVPDGQKAKLMVLKHNN